MSRLPFPIAVPDCRSPDCRSCPFYAAAVNRTSMANDLISPEVNPNSPMHEWVAPETKSSSPGSELVSPETDLVSPEDELVSPEDDVTPAPAGSGRVGRGVGAGADNVAGGRPAGAGAGGGCPCGGGRDGGDMRGGGGRRRRVGRIGCDPRVRQIRHDCSRRPRPAPKLFVQRPAGAVFRPGSCGIPLTPTRHRSAGQWNRDGDGIIVRDGIIAKRANTRRGPSDGGVKTGGNPSHSMISPPL